MLGKILECPTTVIMPASQTSALFDVIVDRDIAVTGTVPTKIGVFIGGRIESWGALRQSGDGWAFAGANVFRGDRSGSYGGSVQVFDDNGVVYDRQEITVLVLSGGGGGGGGVEMQ